MSTVRLEHVYKKYPNGFEAVKDFNLDIADKEFVIFVGPSGCGKSTTLRMIAGLEDISGGDLYIDDKRMNDVEPKDMQLQRSWIWRSSLTVSRRLFPADRDSVLPWAVPS